MGRANAKLDAYAHHPYPVQPQTETPWSGGCKHCQTISMASLEPLTAAVPVARAETHLVDRVWLPDEPARHVARHRAGAAGDLHGRGSSPGVEGVLRRH